MMTTKKMMEDLKKQNPRDIWVCKVCGDDEIEEKVWASMNDIHILNGKTYQLILDSADDCFWCVRCRKNTKPITFDKYIKKGDKNE